MNSNAIEVTNNFETCQSAIDFYNQHGLEDGMSKVIGVLQYWIDRSPIGRLHENYFKSTVFFMLAYDMYKVHGFRDEVVKALNIAESYASGKGQMNAIDGALEILKREK